jgi:hypothetical protein
MKKLVFCFLLFAVIGCDKDTVETVPRVWFKSYSTDVVPQQSALRITLEFTDQEGDLDSVIVSRQRVNARGPHFAFVGFAVPETRGENKGEITISMDYSLRLTSGLNALRIPGSNPSKNEPDTLQLKFRLKDRAGNYSDSTAPQQVVVIR